MKHDIKFMNLKNKLKLPLLVLAVAAVFHINTSSASENAPEIPADKVNRTVGQKITNGPTKTRPNQFSNLSEIQKLYGFIDYYQTNKKITPIKIAIFDKGFKGFEEAIGTTLPKSTTYHSGSMSPAEGSEWVDHGLYMAELVYALMTDSGKHTQFAPAEFHLYDVSGYTNFKAAVDDIITRKIDLVIYTEVWQLGGNWDGKGFINRLVNKAVGAGIIWISAAGNFGQRTYQSQIVTGADSWVTLPDSNNSLHVKCAPPKEAEQQKCNMRATLSWNDFKDDENLGTDKDLDFIVTDDTGKLIGSSTMEQVLKTEARKPGITLYPREVIALQLDPGLYFLKAKDRSLNFQKETDLLRFTVDGDFLTLPSGQFKESLLSPADNPNVITVGDSDTERSSMSEKLGKPDIYTQSRVLLAEKNDLDMRGTSNSAVIFGAGAAMLMSVYPDIYREEILGMLKYEHPEQQAVQEQSVESASTSMSNLTSFDLSFEPVDGSACYPVITPEQNNREDWPWYYSTALSAGGQVVSTSNGIKIMTPFDPVILLSTIRRVRQDDMVVVGERGYALRPRNLVNQLGPTEIEIFQNPSDYPLCGSASNNAQGLSNPGNFRLPILK